MALPLQQLGRTTLGTAIAYKIATGGHKRGSLNRDGAIAAFAVAALAFSCSFRSGITLLCFYKTGSMLTKYGASIKQKLEDDFRSKASAVRVRCWRAAPLRWLVP